MQIYKLKWIFKKNEIFFSKNAIRIKKNKTFKRKKIKIPFKCLISLLFHKS